MKHIVVYLGLRTILTGLLLTSPIFAQSGQTVNSISGFVFDSRSRSPVADVYVELLNDVYSTLKRIKTDGSGRFHFGGISAGTFKVRVLPYNTNYLEEVQDVTITNYRIGSTVTSDNAYIDFYLKLDKRKIEIFEIDSTGVIYVQDVPSSAKEYYKKSLAQLSNPKEVEIGIESLKKAIAEFPDYYDALDRLGTELVKRQQYYDALPHLIRAVTVNQRGFSSFYMLGLAAFNLKQMEHASEAFRAATIIKPESVPALLQYGMILRINGNNTTAEQVLLKALKLSANAPIGAIHWQLALLYYKMERYREAADHLEKYLKKQPDVQNTEQVKELISRIRAKEKT